MAIDNLPVKQHLEAISHAQGKLIDLGIEFGPKLIAAAVILAAGFYVGRWIGSLLDRMLLKLDLDITIRQLLVRIARAVILVLFLIMALQNIGVDLLPLIAGLGVAGAGIALAMQGVLSNLAAGLTIIFTRPYRVGEYISIAGEEGMVENVSLFSTTLSHIDLSRIVIPNRKIAGEILHNYGKIRQLSLSLGVAYNTDLALAMEVVDKIMQNNQRVLQEPTPLVQISKLADSSINISLNPWINVSDYPVVIGELNRAIIESFRINAIIIPFPQHEVRLLEKE